MHLSRRRGGIYYLWYQDGDGRRQKVSTGTTRKSEALQFLREFNQEKHERRKSLCRISLPQFASSYLAYAQSVFSPHSLDTIKASLRRLETLMGEMPLDHIGVREVDLFVADVGQQGRSDRTVRASFVTLASAFETARRWNHIEENPFRKTETPKLRELTPLYFTREEFSQVLAAETDRDLQDLYLFAVLTGLRLREALTLEWKDVQLERGQILVHNKKGFTTKSGRVRSVPMNAEVLALLKARQAGQSDSLVFSYHGRPVTKDIASRHFKACVLRAKVNPKLHYHSMRHTYASWLVQASASLFEVQRLLGHSSIEMTQVYAHLASERLHDTVAKLPALGFPQAQLPEMP